MQLSFLQSQSWEKFQQSVGHKTFRVDGALLIKKPLFFGRSYFYIPRITLNAQRITQFLNLVKELAKKEGCIFLRIEPTAEFRIQNSEFRILKTADIQPTQTLILNLTQSEEELLSGMHPKTRYNIRLAEKKGVKVREGSKNDFEKFWKLMKETTERDGFRSHEKEYYLKMLESEIARLYVAEYKNKILAAGIFVFYGDTATYLHGASTHEHKEVMAPYLLHWEIIKLAKKLGYKYYDFYGINEAKWPGVTRFKKGFGGSEINYPGCYDVVFHRNWYILYKLFRRLRRVF